MTNSLSVDNGRRLAGWTAIAAAVLGVLTVILFAGSMGGDLSLVYQPAVFLGLPASAHSMFHAAMVADSLGFYLAFLLIGGYLWSVLRVEHGALIDMAALCIVTYALLGVAGASVLFASVAPMAAMHAAGDLAVKAATEASWLAIATSTQQGLWLMEGPVMGFWGLVMGKAMRASGMPYGRLLMVVGALYASVFVVGVLQLWAVAELIQTLFLILLPLWALLTGIALLRQPAN